MESIEDDDVLPIPADPPSPIQKRKLKRLKKSSSSVIADSIRVSDDSIVANRDSSTSAAFESTNTADLDPLFSVPSNDPIVLSSASPIYGSSGSGGGKEFEDDLEPLFSVPVVDEGFETLDMERETEEEEGGSYKNIGEIGSGIVKDKSLTKRLDFISPISGSKDFGAEKEMELEDDLDPLFSVPAADKGFEALDLEREREEEKGFEKSGSRIDKKSARKRLNLDEGSEDILKKWKKKKKSKADDKLGEKPTEPIRGKRRSEKERMAQLEQIHAESQRLLRETRDASFKPVPLVQKPISSVLEKIRHRKLN